MRFVSKPVHVNAQYVTDDNLEQVAEWCGGTVGCHLLTDGSVHRYLKFPRANAASTATIAGTWVVQRADGVWVAMSDEEFRSTFDPASSEQDTETDAAVMSTSTGEEE
jgi:hypothetical protein